MSDHRPSISSNAIDSTEFAYRRFWFDYLGKLNDRELQRARSSGLTDWVLIGTAAGIVYKAVPAIPGFINKGGQVVATAGLTLLLTQSVVLLYGLWNGVFAPLTVSDRRDANFIKTVTSWLEVVSIFVLLAGGALEIGLATRPTLPKFVQWGLTVLGTLLVLSSVSVSAVHYWKRRSKNIEILAHIGRAEAISPIITYGFQTLLASACVCLFFTFLVYMQHHGTDWTQPLAASTYVTILFAVGFLLATRAVSRRFGDQLKALELDIVVENLSSKQIRERFVGEMLGPTIAEWLRQLREALEAERLKYSAKITEWSERLSKIEQIDPTYTRERSARAQELLSEIDLEASSFESTLMETNAQIPKLSKLRVSRWQRLLLEDVSAEWEALINETRQGMEPVKDLAKRIAALCGSV